eukprot:SAG31_NODE_528_length_14438_cov_2.252877_10_plen_427_part_00
MLRLGPGVVHTASPSLSLESELAPLAAIKLQLWIAAALGPPQDPSAGKWSRCGAVAELNLTSPLSRKLCVRQDQRISVGQESIPGLTAGGSIVDVEIRAVLLPRSEVWPDLPTAPRDWFGFAVSSAAGWTADEVVDEAAASAIWQAAVGKWQRAADQSTGAGEAQREYRRQLRELATARGAPSPHRGMAWYLLGGGHAKAMAAHEAGVGGSYAERLRAAQQRIHWYCSGAARQAQKRRLAQMAHVLHVAMIRGSAGDGGFGMKLKASSAGHAIVNEVTLGGRAEAVEIRAGCRLIWAEVDEPKMVVAFKDCKDKDAAKAALAHLHRLVCCRTETLPVRFCFLLPGATDDAVDQLSEEAEMKKWQVDQQQPGDLGVATRKAVREAAALLDAEPDRPNIAFRDIETDLGRTFPDHPGASEDFSSERAT